MTPPPGVSAAGPGSAPGLPVEPAVGADVSVLATVRRAGWWLPDWPAPSAVCAFVTTRTGGVSTGPWGQADGTGGGMNLGNATGDLPQAVAANRARLAGLLPAAPVWLHQVHGAEVIDVDAPSVLAAGAASMGGVAPTGDAATALSRGTVCAVLVADCLPVFFADPRGRAVGVAHAGWRGLAGGVLEATVARLRARLGEPAAPLLAWLGPAIGLDHFEVGPEVLAAMRARWPEAGDAFLPSPLGRSGKWHADLYALARLALARCGSIATFGGGVCTVCDSVRCYSYRRDADHSGRQAALIWLTKVA